MLLTEYNDNFREIPSNCHVGSNKNNPNCDNNKGTKIVLLLSVAIFLKHIDTGHYYNTVSHGRYYNIYFQYHVRTKL
jgi:hypothetical protein